MKVFRFFIWFFKALWNILKLFAKKNIVFFSKIPFNFQKGVTIERPPTFFCACKLLCSLFVFSICLHTSKRSLGDIWPRFSNLFVFSKTTHQTWDFLVSMNRTDLKTSPLCFSSNTRLPNLRVWDQWRQRLVGFSYALAATHNFYTQKDIVLGKVNFLIVWAFSNFLIFTKISC